MHESSFLNTDAKRRIRIIFRTACLIAMSERCFIPQVLREHADFRKAGPEVTWSAPVFDIVRRSDKKVVLVLDRSSSMIDFNRMAILRQATYNFITRVIPDGYRLGIVQFNDVSGEADITAPLRVINDTARQQLLTKVPDSVKGRTSIGAVYVDTSIEGEILFLIGADNIESLIVVIQRPDRSTITETEYRFYRRIPDFRLIKVNTNDVMYGTWTITIRNQDTETKRVSLVVEGGVSGTTPTITVKARWAVAEITPPNAQTLFVTVSKGGAIVTAIVSHDTWQMETRLWDDGVGADVRANDGIYSRYITTFDGLGRYGAKVLVSGAPRITKFLSGRRLGSTAPTSNINQSRRSVTNVETGAFQRVVDAGSFKCMNDNTCQASEYTIRWARSFDELDENFTANPIIEKTVVSNAVYYSTVNPNTIPKTAREMEVFTVRLPELGW
ncbi:Calcium-activated chloride channel regulator 1 [Holothuria leucospilota]|uniref:Calcium-activated chloride channel regulator 1 n=1 Tax=Holothuria leucospilota TaxID=206669 RepID=A0A9Q1H1C6_HOLLE|nr:Calcium-activated chloride channel regulator 1 [Holothuria leucospilota]